MVNILIQVFLFYYRPLLTVNYDLKMQYFFRQLTYTGITINVDCDTGFRLSLAQDA